MAVEVQAATWIAAPPTQVWRVLADVAAYPQWNPYVVEAAGALYEGERLRVRLQPHGGRAFTLRPELLCVLPGQELRWRGGRGLPGLFDVEHSFQLQALGEGTHFVQRERFAGPLARLVLSWVRDGVQHGLEAMNTALRTRAEQAVLPEAS